MKLVADSYQRARLRRVIGLALVILAPSLAVAQWYSTKQPLEVLALAERMRGTLPPDEYASAVYHGSHAMETLNNKWSPTGFATIGILGFLAGAGLLVSARRRPPAANAEFVAPT